MKPKPVASLAATVAALVLTVGGAGASAAMMHPKLGARLSGMGEHGTVNLNVTAKSGKLCWTFDLPMVKHITRTSIHTGKRGAMLLEFGMHYSKKGCEKESKMTLEHLEAKPGTYWVWVDTTGHPGELRGRLSASMAHM